MIEDYPDETDTRSILLHTLYAYDGGRERSQQALPGASSLGGCRRQTFYRMVDFPEVNYTSKLASIKGTALHAHIEAAFRWMDPAGERFLNEVTVPGAEGMGDAHVDLYDKKRKVVTDWKTTQKKNLRYFPKQQQRWQVQVYGDRMRQAGYEVEQVELVAIPLDGTEEDLRIHAEPFDQGLANEAYAWLAELYAMKDNGELPPADLSGVICEKYCPFFGPDSCGGK